jgi:small-conductance mechanosensitive channel
MHCTHDVCRSARLRRAVLWPGAIAALAVVSGVWAADADPSATQATAPLPADVSVANRKILTLRAGAYGVTPAERASVVQRRIDDLIGEGGRLVVSTRTDPEGVAILIDGKLALRVRPDDAPAEFGTSAGELAAGAAQNLQTALDEVREVRDSRAILTGIGVAALATLVLGLLLWALLRGYGWAARRLGDLARRRSARLEEKLGHQAFGQLRVDQVVIAPIRLLAVVITLLAVYEWLGLVLKQFPYTRPWGEALLGNLLQALGGFLMQALRAVPGLLFVAIIYVVARFIVKVLRLFFTAVEHGRVQLPWVDETTAKPTGQLLASVVWLLALVAAYPYIPGSGSEAFKGIGVFVGLMLSIGSSGVVNQAVSGLMLMYTRSFRPGEFIRVGDTEGTVRAVGFLTTQIETLRHEQVTIPNAVVVSQVMRNYSRVRHEGGARLATTVTIGYDTPWRQVRAMLAAAAERTGSILQDPAPRILQTGLLDHAVEYTVLVSIPEPAVRTTALDELHANIQDVFNEHGVQIMSPHYEADPPQPKVVPPEGWFAPPASPPAQS